MTHTYSMSMEDKEIKLLLAATGSVAALKIPVLIKTLLESSNSTYNIRLIVTEHAKHFFSTAEISPTVKIYDDSNEWESWKVRGDPVLHIELGKWADLMVVAPLDANTLAKMAQGICDNLLTCTTRAWDLHKPLYFCPAMNTRMWEHPITLEQVGKLKSWGYTEIPPIEKLLICGDSGMGAMAELDTIIAEINNRAPSIISSRI